MARLSEEADKALMDFLGTEQAAGRGVSNHLLQEHACRLAVQMELGTFEATAYFLLDISVAWVGILSKLCCNLCFILSASVKCTSKL